MPTKIVRRPMPEVDDVLETSKKASVESNNTQELSGYHTKIDYMREFKLITYQDLESHYTSEGTLGTYDTGIPRFEYKTIFDDIEEIKNKRFGGDDFGL